MRLVLLMIASAGLFTACSTKTVVYEEPRRTVLVEPAGTPMRVYPARPVQPVYQAPYYYESYGPRKLGEYHMR